MDLLNDVMRMPYRERFTLIINELGAAVAGRSDDLQAALRRAVPALNETDNLLNLLANDSNTINPLNVNADTVITELANNSTVVQNFIDKANKISVDSATQSSNIAEHLARAARIPRAAASGAGAAERRDHRQPAGGQQPQRGLRAS